MNLKVRHCDNTELLCPFCRKWYEYEKILVVNDYTTHPMIWCECGALSFLEGTLDVFENLHEITEIPMIKIDRILNIDLVKYKCERQLSGGEVKDFITNDFNSDTIKKYGIEIVYDNYTDSDVNNINFNLGYVLDGYNLDDCHCLNLDHDGIYIFAISTDGRKFCFWGD